MVLATVGLAEAEPAVATETAPRAGVLAVQIAARGLDGRTLIAAPDGVADAAGTLDDPLTLQAAADRVEPGDTVLVRAGTYRNADRPGEMAALIIRRGGTAERWVRFANYPDEKPLIEFNSLRGIKVEGAAYVVIEGFEIDGRNDEVDPAEAYAHAEAFTGDGYDRNEFFGVGIRLGTSGGEDPAFPHHVIIRNNHVHHCSGGGIATARADYVLIEDNTVHHTSFYTPWGGSAISVWSSANFDDRQNVYRTVVRGNTCYQNDNLTRFWMMRKFSDGNGIIMDALQNTQDNITQDGYDRQYNGRILVAHNVCFFNGGRGINLYESDRIDVLHNTLYHNALRDNIENEIEIGRAHHVRTHNNIIVPAPGKRAIGGYQSERTAISHNLVHGGEPHPDFPLGPGTVDADPGFRQAPPPTQTTDPPVDPRSFDFTLRSSSPARDAGAPDFAVPASPDEHRRPDLGAHFD